MALILLEQSLLQEVVAVADGIARAAREVFGDMRPFIADLNLVLHDCLVLLLRPWLAGDAGLEHVMPALVALLGVAVIEMRRNDAPLLRAHCVHQLLQAAVLLRRPCVPFVRVVRARVAPVRKLGMPVVIEWGQTQSAQAQERCMDQVGKLLGWLLVRLR